MKDHNIAGSHDGALTDYQVKLVIHSGQGTDYGSDVYLDGNSMNWPNDIQFTNASGDVLSYWIESYDPNSATVWVKVDDIPAWPGITTIMLFYGGANTPIKSNITKTMIFGDDFHDLKGWGTYSYGPLGSIYADNGALVIRSGANGNPSTEGVKRFESFASDHTAWGVKMRASGGEATFYTLTVNPTTDPWHYRSWYRLNASDDHISFDRNTEGTTGSYIPPTLAIDKSFNNMAYHVYEIRYDGANVAGYCDGSKVYGEPSRIDGNLYLSLQNCRYGTPESTYADYVYIRKYTPDEPIQGNWSGARDTNPGLDHKPPPTIPTIPPNIAPTIAVPGPSAAVRPSAFPVPGATSISGYRFVKAHAINGSPDGALTGYQVKFIVHSGQGTDNGQDVYLNGHAQSWPNDIRFTDDSGSPLDYWVESSDTKVATIWVKMKSIPVSPGTASVYLYYGKPGDAGAGNGKATFPYYEDWSSYPPGSNISDQGGWTVRRLGGTGEAKVVTDNGVNVLLIGSATPDNTVIAHNFSLYNGQAYRYGAKKLSGSDNLQLEACDGVFGANGAIANGYDVVYGGYAQAYTAIRKFVNGSEADMARVSDNTGDTSYHTYEWAWSGADFQALRDGVQLTNGSDSTWTSKNTLALSVYQSNAYCSYVLVRNYTASEPGHGPWGDEVRSTPAPTIRQSDYSNVKTQAIHGSPDGTLTDYQLKFVVHRGSGKDSGQDVYLNGRSQSWPNDMRFTNTGGDVLGYWVESYDSNTATVWVKADRIPGSPGTATIMLYYGRPGDEGMSSGDDTFILFDDFNDGSIDPNKWAKVLGDPTADVFERNGRLELLSGPTPYISRPFLRSAAVYSGNYVIDVDAKYSGKNSIIVATDWDGRLAGEYSGPNRAYECSYVSWASYPRSNYWQVARDDDGNRLNVLEYRDQDLNTSYHHITVIQRPRITLRVDGETLVNADADTNYTSGYVGLGGREGMDGIQTYYDTFRMSKYTDNPPEYGDWAVTRGNDGGGILDGPVLIIATIVILLVVLAALTIALIGFVIIAMRNK